MRPLHLFIQAFGPYADVVELDFRQLRDISLFLIHGPTGSGKTTILDAMCFALFGAATGQDRKPGDVRSHFADEKTLTKVAFEFALGEATWRVSRVAAHPRPGGGVAKPTQATLERIAADGTTDLRASRVREVDSELSTLLGFQLDQFRQVVLLPQGEFRRLLVADSAAREKILEVLFNTELYRRIERELERAGAALRREAAEARTGVEALLRGSDAESVEALRESQKQAQSHHAELVTRAKILRETAAVASEHLSKAQKIATAFAERTAALAALQKLEGQVPSTACQRDEVKMARLAQGLEAGAERWSNAVAALGRETARRVAADARQEKSNNQLQQSLVALAAENARASEREEAETRRRFLEKAKLDAIRLRDTRAEVAAADTRLADATGAVGLCGRGISYAEGRVDAADKAAKPLRVQVGEIDKLRAQVADLRRIQATLTDLESARSFLMRQLVESGGAREAEARAETALVAAQAAESQMQHRWEQGQAAHLAATLSTDEPCPVCGSVEHPSPAVGGADVPDQRMIEDARRAVAAAHKALDASRAALAKEKAKEESQRASVKTLERTLGEDAGLALEEVRARAASATAVLVEAGKADIRLKDLDKERADHLTEATELRAEQTAAQALVGEEEKKLAASRALAEELVKSVPDDVAHGDVVAMLSEATRRAAQLVRALDEAKTAEATARAAVAGAIAEVEAATTACHEAQVAADSIGSEFEAARIEAGFEQQKDFISARRAVAEVDAMEAVLRRFDESLASARERATRAEAALATDSKDSNATVEPDLEASRNASATAQGALEAGLAEQSRVQEEIRARTQTLDAVGETVAKMEVADRRYRSVGHVANVASGDNGAGVSFVRFVLGSLLDDVLAAATERLLRMSQGRFELVRAGARRDRRRAGGLDLEVFDAHTGVERPASTLSGGESFLASLALALGLADVVQSHSGGVRLETMFIDEGFGTLDPEALDLAMRALEDLRAGGRLVGMISHVPELKERVGARLEVVSGLRGSTARFVV